MGHLAGEDEDRFDLVIYHYFLDFSRKISRGECRQRNGLAARHGLGGGARGALAPIDDRAARGEARQHRIMAAIAGIVGKGDQMNARMRRDVAQQMIAADLVAAIGWIGHAVCKEQNVAHQPSPRAIGGPIRLAIHSGSRFQVATCNR